jgi:integrase
VRAFFRWLSTTPGYRSLSAGDAEYFNLPARETRIAYARKEKPVATTEQIIHVLRCAPSATEVELRDRALIAFTLLTGARDGATASLKIKHLDVVDRRVLQPALEVNTKAAKTIDTWFFPVPSDVLQIVSDWVQRLKENHFGPEDPLFPSTRTGLVQGKFAATGLTRSNWATTTPVRKIFKAAFQRAGLPYCNPHSFRTTLALLGVKICRNAEELKAWSQNLGHEGVLTTLTSYGNIGATRQGQIMLGFTMRQTEEPTMINVAVLKDAIDMITQRQGFHSPEAEEIARLIT